MPAFLNEIADVQDVRGVLHGSDWITKGEPFLSLRKRQEHRQNECGENAAHQHQPYSLRSCPA